MTTRCMKCGELAARRCKTGDCRHCDACGFAFVPCAADCRGFHLNLDARDGCLIEICDGCVTSANPRQRIRVPGSLSDRLTDHDARGWPEAYRAAAKLLTAVERASAPSSGESRPRSTRSTGRSRDSAAHRRPHAHPKAPRSTASGARSSARSGGST